MPKKAYEKSLSIHLLNMKNRSIVTVKFEIIIKMLYDTSLTNYSTALKFCLWTLVLKHEKITFLRFNLLNKATKVNPDT